MKTIIKTSLLATAAAALLTGCAVQPQKALIFSDATSPIHATNAQGSKTGESEVCTNILGVIATGDCSISNAKKNGGINKVSSVDWKGTNILTIITTGKTVVTGE